MNSWHSFSPNGRWLVFSSKSRSPYTQMYLTHIDEDGNDSPAILVEGNTAANRAVNIPEFVNIPPGGLLQIEAPAAEFYARFDRAWELSRKGQFEAAIPAWRSALELSPDDARANNNLGFALARQGRLAESIAPWETALKANDQIPEVRKNLVGALENLGVAALRKGNLTEALPHLRRAAELDPQDTAGQYNLGLALLRGSSFDEAIAHFQRALALDPSAAQVHNDLAVALAQKRRFEEAAAQFRQAIASDPDSPRLNPTWHGCWPRVRQRLSGTVAKPSNWRRGRSICHAEGTPRCSMRWPPRMPKRAGFQTRWQPGSELWRWRPSRWFRR